MDELLTRRFSRTARIGFAAACTVVALLVVAPFLIPVNRFRSTIEQRASSALGRHVSLGRLRVSLLRQSLSAETLTVADDPAFSASPNPVSAVGGGGGAAEAIGSAIGTAGALGGLLGTITGGSTAGKIAGAAGHVAGTTGHVTNQRIPFLVEGTTSNLQIIPDLSGVALRMLQGQLGALALRR